MGITTLYFTGVILFITAAIAAVAKKKIRSAKAIRYLSIFHFAAFILTIFLIILWGFGVHLPGPILEIIPFWLFVFSAIFIFGVTSVSGSKKMYTGVIFFTHLFFSAFVWVPFLGIAFTYPVYSNFMPDGNNFVFYENSQVRVQLDTRGIMSPNGSPSIYFKCGWYELKRQSHTGPLYELDSVAIKKIDDKKVKLDFYDFSKLHPSSVISDTIACECL